jgi:hypothetical protein
MKKQRRPKGRPAIEGVRRTYSLRVPLTETDHELYSRLAKEENRSLADWVRLTLKRSVQTERAA